MKRGPFSGSPVGGASAAVLAAALAIVPISTPLHARDGEKQDSVAQNAVDAVASPLRDLNIKTRDIPPVLQLAKLEPYRISGLEQCEALWSDIDALEEVLGPDADAPTAKEGVVNKGLRNGSKLFYSFVPFRSVVRRVSGAKAKQNEFDAAVYAGVARRSFLKGVAQGRECIKPQPDPLADAYDLLGMTPASEGLSLNAPTGSGSPDW